MQYKTIKGNLFDYLKPGDACVHGCNNQAVMGSGIALEIKNRFPGAYELYHETHKKSGLWLGTIIPYHDNSGKIIINAITQDGYGRDGSRFVQYDAVAMCFAKIAKWFNSIPNPPKTLYFPLIGAGLGGGSWPIISAIILDELKNLSNTELVLVEFK